MNLALTAALLGGLIAGGILYLVRRDHLHGSYALWWLLVGVAALLLGFNPGWVDTLGNALGVRYPPMLLVVLAIIALLLKLLQADIDVSRRERRLRRLVQKVAILELELHNLAQRLPAADPESIVARLPAPPAAPADTKSIR